MLRFLERFFGSGDAFGYGTVVLYLLLAFFRTFGTYRDLRSAAVAVLFAASNWFLFCSGPGKVIP